VNTPLRNVRQSTGLDCGHAVAAIITRRTLRTIQKYARPLGKDGMSPEALRNLLERVTGSRWTWLSWKPTERHSLLDHAWASTVWHAPPEVVKVVEDWKRVWCVGHYVVLDRGFILDPEKRGRIPVQVYTGRYLAVQVSVRRDLRPALKGL